MGILMNDPVLVSVLIPMYQAGRYIEEAVRSVFAQPERSLELIIVDDGSTDGCASAAEDALRAFEKDPRPARLIRMPHRGQAAARNTALASSSGEWIFYLDADDVLTEGALAALLRGAAEMPEAGIICGMCRDFISPELSPEEKARLQTEPLPYHRMLSGCTLVRRSLYGLVGPYNETLPSSETAEWMLRAQDAGALVHEIGDVTMRRRYHANNFGRRDRDTQLKSYMEIIRLRRAGGRKKSGENAKAE